MSKFASGMIPIYIHNIKDIIIALRDSDNFLNILSAQRSHWYLYFLQIPIILVEICRDK